MFVRPFRGTVVGALLGAVLSVRALAFIDVYHVVPTTASLNDWTQSRGWVSETVMCDFDSLVRCQLFAGDVGAGGLYCAAVYDGGNIIAQSHEEPQGRDLSWVSFDVWTFYCGFIKGRQYEFRFTRSSDDSIDFYYRDDDPYKHGQLLAPGVDPLAPSVMDLCMRVYGVAKPIREGLWGAKAALPWWIPGRSCTWSGRAREAGLGLIPVDMDWAAIEPVRGTYDFAATDSYVQWYHDSAGVGAELIGTLVRCPSWASSRINDSTIRRHGGRDTCHHCPPRNLFAPIESDTNYWAAFVDTVVKRYGGSIHTWELYNESNTACTTKVEPDQEDSIDHTWWGGWWRYPNIDSAYRWVDDARDLCELYVQLGYVANSVIKLTNNRSDDRVLIGALACVNDSDDTMNYVMGKEWLRMCYEIAAAPGGLGVFWNGVSVHPYPKWWWGREFLPDTFEAEAETLHAIMRSYGHRAELWNTEIGWPRRGYEDTLLPANQHAARNLGEMYVRSIATQALPGGGYERACWWIFNELGGDFGYYAMLDSDLNRNPAFYAFKQMTHRLTGKRFETRVMQGGARDDSVRVYEFEDPATLRRTWVCWKNGGMDSAVRVEVRVPTMTDRLMAESLAYRDGRPPSLAVRPGADGWLALFLDERPVFVSETGVPKCPDLVVDSVRVVPANPKVGESLSVRAWVRNQGTRATPRGYASRVLFTADGDTIGGAEVARGIAVGQAVRAEFRLGQVPSGMSGPVLFAATVNPGRRYVEFDMDNNTGYMQAVVE
jgi:hypothetical protein